MYIDNQLELDFFSVPSVQTNDPPESTPLFEWDEEAVYELRKGVLKVTLRVLCDARASLASKKESLDWVKSDEIHPFSFRVCCADLGYCYESLRSQVVSFYHSYSRKQRASQRHVGVTSVM